MLKHINTLIKLHSVVWKILHLKAWSCDVDDVDDIEVVRVIEILAREQQYTINIDVLDEMQLHTQLVVVFEIDECEQWSARHLHQHREIDDEHIKSHKQLEMYDTTDDDDDDELDSLVVIMLITVVELVQTEQVEVDIIDEDDDELDTVHLHQDHQQQYVDLLMHQAHDIEVIVFDDDDEVDDDFILEIDENDDTSSGEVRVYYLVLSKLDVEIKFDDEMVEIDEYFEIDEIDDSHIQR